MADRIRRFRIDCSDEVTREWLLAEAFEVGAEGAEESEADGRFRADIYGAPLGLDDIRSAVAAIPAEGVLVGDAEDLPEVDWSEAWKEGLTALEISPRLVIRPPFVSAPEKSGQFQVVIDPGQAFGTGNHGSTRLCLTWMDRLMSDRDMGPIDRVLDVGTGSGVLALSAVALGATRAIGFDLDPVAVEAAEAAARENGLADRVGFFAGPIEAVAKDEPAFPLVVANLLKREMLPIATEIAERVSAEGRLVLAGLLVEDIDEVLERFAEEGLVETGRLEHADPIGVWVGPCLARATREN